MSTLFLVYNDYKVPYRINNHLSINTNYTSFLLKLRKYFVVVVNILSNYMPCDPSPGVAMPGVHLFYQSSNLDHLINPSPCKYVHLRTRTTRK